jgi:WXG100 family type VII secretion target
MAILTQLSITEVADLRAEADAFEGHATELKALTDSMFDIVDGTAAVWSGSAHDQFVARFDGLRDEMDYLYRTVEEYHTDLVEIASNYEAAESDNDSISQSLSSDIDLV